MVIQIPADLESALVKQASDRGVSPEAVVVEMLRGQLLKTSPPIPIDEWERRLFSVATDCGVSVPNEALSSEGLYD